MQNSYCTRGGYSYTGYTLCDGATELDNVVFYDGVSIYAEIDDATNFKISGNIQVKLYGIK